METPYRKLIFLLLLLTGPLLGYEMVNVQQGVTLKNTSYFVDPDHRSADTIYTLYRQGDFLPAPRYAKSFGFSSDTYWFAFDIQNAKTGPLYLESRLRMIDHLTLYEAKQNNLEAIAAEGYESKGKGDDGLRLKLPGNGLYFLRIESTQPLFLGFVLGDKSYTAFHSTHQQDRILIFTFGLVAGMLAYNFMLYLSSRDRLYLYYIGYIGATAVVALSTQGYLGLLSESLKPYTDILISVSLQIATLFIGLFTIRFLNLQDEDKRLRSIILITLLLALIGSSFITFSDTLKILGPLSINLYILSLFYAGIRSYLRGFHPAMFYLLATGIGIIFLIIYSLLPVLPEAMPYSTFTFHAANAGLIWDTVMLSFAFAYRLKVLEQQKLRSEQMLIAQSKQNSIGELLGNIAHQWRTPLAKIGAINMVMKDKLEHESECDRPEMIKQIDTNAAILTDLSETITTFQNFFQNITKKERFEVSGQITKVIDFVSTGLIQNNITITTELEENHHLTGNKNYLNHALMNILLNAKDIFIQRGIKKRTLHIVLKKAKGSLLLTISDNAGGIDVEPIEDIFKPYVSQRKEGTGLGMFITQQLIQKGFEGMITAQNNNKGAVFTLTLPTTGE